MSAGGVIEHGGALARAKARFGAGDDWIDLSTGINPWPYPLPEIPAASWARLPDEDALAALKAAARRFYGVGPDMPIAAAPGSQALIQLVPRLVPPGRVAVVGPTYAEHAHCWRLAGHEVVETADLDAEAPVLVVGNPNNPDGRCWPVESLVAAARGRLVVADEAFGEVSLGRSAADGTADLLALRSFGKFFGLAGLRLGFALGPAALVRRIEDALGPWAVSGPALAVATAALGDADWASATRRRLARAAAELDAVLMLRGLTPIGGTDLFRLVRTTRAQSLFERLGAAHILVRRFADRSDWLRFGLAPDGAALARLDQALG
jgi:cobalamin biosynthetic protein CobC